MSGELVEKLRHRATLFLREAEKLFKEDEYDIACFNAEQAIQLYIKSVTLKLFGEIPRIHSIRELLGYLARKLYEQEFKEKAILIKEFAKENRYSLSILEDAYIDARYTIRSFTKQEASEAIKTASNLIKLLKSVEKDVWLGQI